MIMGSIRGANEYTNNADLSRNRSQLGMFASSLCNFSHDLDDSIRQINQSTRTNTGIGVGMGVHRSIERSSDAYSEGRHEEYIFGEAGDFLLTQQRRLHIIEKYLLIRIEDILPVESDLMTATELVQVCQRLHSVNLGFATHLQSIHHRPKADDCVPVPVHTYTHPHTQRQAYAQKYGVMESTPNPNTPGEKRLFRNTSQPIRLSTNGPLLSVVETDYETDATTTPASTMVGNERTPVTNTGSNFSLGSTTSYTAPLQNESCSPSPSVDFIEAWRSRQSLNCATDYLDHTTSQDAPCSITDPALKVDAHLRFRESSGTSSVPNDGYHASSDQHSRANDTTAFDDESVSLAPTVKGHGFFKKQALEQHKHASEVEPHCITQQLRSHRVSDPPISELVLEEEEPCCYQNNDITFDRSVLTEHSMSSPTRSRMHEVGDESLLVTPTLARYCLEPDDSSIGVRVVPKDAVSGKHRIQHTGRNRKPQSVHTQHRNAAPNEIRKRQAPLHNATPNEKDNFLHRIEESALLSPNVSVRTPQKGGKFDCRAGVLAENVFREIRPIDEATDQLSFGAKSNPSDKIFLGDSTDTGRRGLTQRFEETAAMRRKTVDVAGIKLKTEKVCVAVVSFEEYDSAPSVVRMQVGVEEINTAVHVLNLWFGASHAEESPRLNEEIAARALNISQRKSKIILMSLCHWRRLNMYMDEGTGVMYFIPNPRQRSPRLTL